MNLFLGLGVLLLSLVCTETYGATITTTGKVELPLSRRTLRSDGSASHSQYVPLTLSFLRDIGSKGIYPYEAVSKALSSPPQRYEPLRRVRRLVRPRSVVSNNNLRKRGRSEVIADMETNSPGDLRFLGWLFGRPSYYSRYPNYSVLEEAAGISPYYGSSSRLPSLGHPDSTVMIEDCTELLDPLTHEIIEDCHDVPAAIVPLGH